MSIVTATLKVISPVSTQEDVFGHLILVQDETGAQFTLGCAHFCRWTEEQLTTADKLEGCYTPQRYAEDDRLLLGYHPDAVTGWKIKQTDEEVFLEMYTDLNPRLTDEERVNRLEVDYPSPLTVYDSVSVPNLRLYRKIWASTKGELEPSRRVAIFYATLRRLEEARRLKTELGRITWELIVKDWAYSQGITEVRWEEVEEDVHCQHYYDAMIVWLDRPVNGYSAAVGLEEKYPEAWKRAYEDEDWIVFKNRTSYTRESIIWEPSGHRYESTVVTNCSRPGYGYERAIPLK